MTDFETFLAKTRTANVVPVIESLSADLLTPVAVYLKMSKNASDSFLLESVEGGETLARYSFIGADPEMIVSGNDKAIRISSRNGKEEMSVSLIEFLRTHFHDYNVLSDEGLPSFIGGAIGYFGFSCSEWFELSLKSGKSAFGGTDESSFMFFRSLVAFDHVKQIVKIISLVFVDENPSPDGLKAAYEKAAATNRRIRKTLENSEITQTTLPRPADNDPVRSNWARKDFENAVREIKELITAGECYQVVISQCFSKKTNASPIAIYRAMRSLNPSPYMFLLQNGSNSIIGASPEMLVRCRGIDLEYRPIAGTRPRGKTPEEDSLLADEMRTDAKEVAEHQMLVDLGRNDLGRVAQFGSVSVDGLMSVEKYSHVQHLVSCLSAKLRDEFDRFDALAACFPAGTVSGAPKVRAIEIIESLEPTPRGIYAGAVGYFDYSGNMDTCISIRTLVLVDGLAKVQAGAGIVADSVPELEYQETINKAKALLKAIEIAEGNIH